MKAYLIVAMFLLIKPACFGQTNYLVFAKGGGISGQINSFKLMENGTVLKGSGVVAIDYNEVSKLKKRQTKKIFKEFELMRVESFSKPGNTYCYVSYFNEDSELKYTWGATGFDPPEEITTFYHEMMLRFNELIFESNKNQNLP